MNDIIKTKIGRNRRLTRPFILETSSKILDKELDALPKPDGDIIKMMSLCGGVASASFIKFVADKEPIEELTASTLRIGEKQFRYIEQLYKTGKLKGCRFFISTMMKNVDSKTAKYNYSQRFFGTCQKNGWKCVVVNNHSKIILMRTAANYYVLETSSNLNENPKIEQYSFENSRQLYRFYYEFFDVLEASVKPGEG